MKAEFIDAEKKVSLGEFRDVRVPRTGEIVVLPDNTRWTVEQVVNDFSLKKFGVFLKPVTDDSML